MKKIILAALVVASLFASCSSEKTFKKKDGSTITAKPYGWASKENKVVDIGDYSDWEEIDGKHYCPDCYKVKVIDGVYYVKQK